MIEAVAESAVPAPFYEEEVENGYKGKERITYLTDGAEEALNQGNTPAALELLDKAKELAVEHGKGALPWHYIPTQREKRQLILTIAKLEARVSYERAYKTLRNYLTPAETGKKPPLLVVFFICIVAVTLLFSIERR